MKKSNGAALAVVKAETSTDEPTLNYVSFAKSLFDADWSAMADVTSTKENALVAIAARQTSFLERLRIAAIDVPGITPAQWDAHITPSLKEAYLAQDYKAGPSRASQIKVAVLAFTHGIEVPEGMTNFQTFVNKIARPALQSLGVLKVTNEGRKPVTKEAGMSAREESAMCLSQTGGLADEVVARRMAMLLTLTNASNWKLLDRVLEDAMKLIGK